MAISLTNTNSPFGLIPSQTTSASAFNGVTMNYSILSTNANPIYIGDPVVMTVGAVDTANNNMSVVTRATAGSSGKVVGIVINPKVFVKNVSDTLRYVPANTAAVIGVAVDHALEFYIQADSGTITASNIGQTADFSYGVGGSGDKSGVVLNTSTLGTGTQMVITRFASEKNGNYLGQPYAIVCVKLLTYQF